MQGISSWGLTSRENTFKSISLASYNQLDYRVHKLDETDNYKEVIILVSRINAFSYFAGGKSCSQFADIIHK